MATCLFILIQMVEDLFDKGVKDYVSVDLWLEYCQFGIGGIGTEEGAKKATNTKIRFSEMLKKSPP